MVHNNNLTWVMDAGNHFKYGSSQNTHISKENNRISINSTKLLILFILTVFLFSSCDKNEIDNNFDLHDYVVQNVFYAKDSKLKHISHVESIQSKKGGLIISQYEYDEQGRISKVSQPMYEDGTPIYENGTIVGILGYSDYIYNNEGLLEKIIYYHSNIYQGFINLETKTYSYDKSGNKRKEVIEYPRASPFRTDSTLYYYDNNLLKREEKFNEGYNGSNFWHSKLISYIVYEYNKQNQLIKEISYSTEDNKPIQTSLHYYQSGVNVKTEVINNYFKDDKVREIRRYYDRNDNLIYLESKELSVYSSSMSYVIKHDYY